MQKHISDFSSVIYARVMMFVSDRVHGILFPFAIFNNYCEIETCAMRRAVVHKFRNPIRFPYQPGGASPATCLNISF